MNSEHPPASETTSPTPSEPAAAEQDPSYTHTRTGKVARLPKVLRDHVNQMLLDGVPFAKIIETIGEPAKDITEKNIGNWKTGGYQDWLLDLDRNDALRLTRESALELASQKAGATVQDAGRAIAAAQLYELLLAFNPAVFAKALANNPELYLRLVNALARLSEGEAACGHHRAQESLIEAKLKPAQPGKGPAVISPETLTEIARLIKLL